MIGTASAAAWLDPTRPRVAFIFRVPFNLGIDTANQGTRLVIPLAGQRQPAVLSTARVNAQELPTDGPIRYLVQRVDPPRRYRNHMIPQVQLSPTWIIDIELDNNMQGGQPAGRLAEERIFLRALELVNRYLHAYMIATEEPDVRFLTPEALDPHIIAEFRHLDGSPIDSGGFTLPASERAPRSMDPGLLQQRLHYAMRAEAAGHPIDEYVLWRVRAEHLINYVGDYELSVLALQTSAELLLYAVATAICVDKGCGATEVAEVRAAHFAALPKRLQHDLGGNWDRKCDDQPFGQYWQLLYVLRNQIGHAGRRITFEQADHAFQAYRQFTEFFEDRVLERTEQFPGAALMLFGRATLMERGSYTSAVARLVEDLDRNGQLYGWWEP